MKIREEPPIHEVGLLVMDDDVTREARCTALIARLREAGAVIGHVIVGRSDGGIGLFVSCV